MSRTLIFLRMPACVNTTVPRKKVATDLRELKADIYELGRTLDDSGSNGIAPLIDRRRRNVSAVDRRRKYTNTASSHSNNGDMDESNINEGRRTEAKRRYRTPLASDECNRDNCLNRPSSINADNNCGRADEDPRKTGTRERSSKPSHSLDGEHGEYSREERKRAETAGVPSDPRWSGPLPRPSMKNPLSLAWDTSSNGIAATGISVGTNVGLSSVSADYGGVSRVGELVERIEASARAVARDKKDTINVRNGVLHPQEIRVLIFVFIVHRARLYSALLRISHMSSRFSTASLTSL